MRVSLSALRPADPAVEACERGRFVAEDAAVPGEAKLRRHPGQARAPPIGAYSIDEFSAGRNPQ